MILNKPDVMRKTIEISFSITPLITIIASLDDNSLNMTYSSEDNVVEMTEIYSGSLKRESFILFFCSAA